MNLRKASSYYLFSVFITALMLMGGCAYTGRNALLKTPFDADTLKGVFVVNSKGDQEGYYNRIKAEDELAISDLQDISLLVRTDKERYTPRTDSYAIFQVNENGMISLPLLGQVAVAGLTRLEAAKRIQQLYEQNELRKPLIDVRINNLYVVVLGEVARQGKYIINREDYELIDLLGEAGGLTPGANKRSVKIFRGDRRDPEIILLNLEDYGFLKEKNLRLRSRDVIYVEPRRIVSNAQSAQAYSPFFQVGLVLLNTVLLIINLSN